MATREETIKALYGEKLFNTFSSRSDDVKVFGILSDNKDMDADNLYQIFVQNDPTPNKKYLQWMVLSYIKGGYLLEDITKIPETLDLFNRHKKKLDVDQRDINKYVSLTSVWNSISKYKELDAIKEENDLEKQAIYNDTDFLLDIPGVLKILSPKTREASIFWGRGTRWCTASAKSHNFFDNYNEDGPLYIIILENGEKFQFHQRNQRHDSLIDPSTTFLDAKDEDFNPAVFTDRQIKELFLFSLQNNLFMKSYLGNPGVAKTLTIEDIYNNLTTGMCKELIYNKQLLTYKDMPVIVLEKLLNTRFKRSIPNFLFTEDNVFNLIKRRPDLIHHLPQFTFRDKKLLDRIVKSDIEFAGEILPDNVFISDKNVLDAILDKGLIVKTDYISPDLINKELLDRLYNSGFLYGVKNIPLELADKKYIKQSLKNYPDDISEVFDIRKEYFEILVNHEKASQYANLIMESLMKADSSIFEDYDFTAKMYAYMVTRSTHASGSRYADFISDFFDQFDSDKIWSHITDCDKLLEEYDVMRHLLSKLTNTIPMDMLYKLVEKESYNILYIYNNAYKDYKMYALAIKSEIEHNFDEASSNLDRIITDLEKYHKSHPISCEEYNALLQLGLTHENRIGTDNLKSILALKPEDYKFGYQDILSIIETGSFRLEKTDVQNENKKNQVSDFISTMIQNEDDKNTVITVLNKIQDDNIRKTFDQYEDYIYTNKIPDTPLQKWSYNKRNTLNNTLDKQMESNVNFFANELESVFTTTKVNREMAHINPNYIPGLPNNVITIAMASKLIVDMNSKPFLNEQEAKNLACLLMDSRIQKNDRAIALMGKCLFQHNELFQYIRPEYIETCLPNFLQHVKKMNEKMPGEKIIILPEVNTLKEISKKLYTQLRKEKLMDAVQFEQMEINHVLPYDYDKSMYADEIRSEKRVCIEQLLLYGLLNGNKKELNDMALKNIEKRNGFKIVPESELYVNGEWCSALPEIHVLENMVDFKIRNQPERYMDPDMDTFDMYGL